MENHIPSRFKCPTVASWVEYPNELAFCIICINEKVPNFTTRFKFCSVIGKYMCGAFCAEWAEVGEIGFMFEP
jgi:hypothetical protein